MIKNVNFKWLVLLLVLFQCKESNTSTSQTTNTAEVIQKDGMVWIPAGEFVMGAKEQSGTNDAQAAHPVKVNGFWMDETEITNRQYVEFVEATGYVTLAERPIDWEEMKKLLPAGTPKPPDEDLQPGSLVFTPPNGPVALNDYSQWWSWVVGADWKHPLGPDSNIDGKENYPVVQLAYEDAEAFAKWAGKRLPTEAEFEYAARGGLDFKTFSWGDELNPQGKYLANYFQGAFPYNDSGDDGFSGIAPVKSYPPNGFGLYDMTGNVWELCTDWFAVEDFNQSGTSTIVINPRGPAKTYDPNDPYAVKRVSKGGSFLCSHEYCSNYKPSGRQGSSFDTGMNHTGFRCVKDN